MVKNIWKSYIWTADKNVNEMIHDQLPVGLLAQLVERCTGITEVMGSNPVQAWIFSGLISATSSVVFIAVRITYISELFQLLTE